MKKIKIGFIGTGLIANVHMRSLMSLIEDEIFPIEVIAATDVDKDRLEKFCIKNNIEKICNDPMDVIKDKTINTVYICTPTKFHKEYVLKLLKEGKNIFCEKPLATNLNDVKEMCNAAKHSSPISQVGFVIRYSPIFEFLKDELLNNEELGKMMTIMFRNDQTFPIGGKYGSFWRSDKNVSGGGTLIEHSIHDIDILMAIGGKFKSVYCNTRYFSKYNVEDLGILSYELENNVIGTLTSCWHNIPRRDERLIEIFFEKGWIKIEISEIIKIITRINRKTKKLDPNKVQKQICEKKGINPNYLLFPYYYEDLEFIRAVYEMKKSKTGFESSRAATPPP